MKPRVARLDPSLRATVVSRKPLHYRTGADEAFDRPAYLRAGSSLAWVDDRLALIQDDTNFIALVDPTTGLAESIALPAGEGGLRQFHDARGNKKFKLDLEACCAIPGERLLAFGSGSKHRRRRAVIVDHWRDPEPRVALIDATALYLALESTVDFAGSDMNIEGALLVPGAIRLFGRANGRERDGRVPLNASCDLQLDALLSYFADPEAHAPPVPAAIVQYALGEFDGLPIGFTDAAICNGAVWYSAAAEASKDASEDGPVSGSVLGVIPESGDLRYAPITDRDGTALREKVEGLAPIPGAPDRLYAVIDGDDATRPSELCEVQLDGW